MSAFDIRETFGTSHLLLLSFFLINLFCNLVVLREVGLRRALVGDTPQSLRSEGESRTTNGPQCNGRVGPVVGGPRV